MQKSLAPWFGTRDWFVTRLFLFAYPSIARGGSPLLPLQSECVKELGEANESELATAFANAIENAIHACEKLPKEERKIEIKVICKPKFIVMVRNSFDGNVEFDEHGIPLCGKEGHGIGTRSIVAFCSKAGGYYEFQAKDKIFTLFMHLK